MRLKLKAGCYYRTRGGAIRGPMRYDGFRMFYPWTDGERTWMRGGHCLFAHQESPHDLIAEVPAPTKPKARKRKGRKMLVRWAMIVVSGIGTMQGYLGDGRKDIRSKRAYLIREGLSCGPITRITLPAPAGRGKK